MRVTRAFVPWPSRLAAADAAAALAALGCAVGPAGEEDALAAGLVEAEARGLVIDRRAPWSAGDLAVVRGLTRDSGGFGTIVTHSSIDSSEGVALFLAGHLVARYARGPLAAAGGDPRGDGEPRRAADLLRGALPPRADHWDVFERWLQLLGGPPLGRLAEAANELPHDHDCAGAADPGPPPPSSHVLLFEPADAACAAAAARLGPDWAGARSGDDLWLARGPRPPSLDDRRALAAAHVRGVVWSLSGDGPPELVEDLHGDVHPLDPTGDRLLEACAAVTACAGFRAGVIARAPAVVGP